MKIHVYASFQTLEVWFKIDEKRGHFEEYRIPPTTDRTVICAVNIDEYCFH